MACAYWVRVPPCSTALSRGPSACAHWLSVRPSQKNQAPCAVPAIGMVRRSVVPMPWPSGVPSWNSRPATWQVAHETLPLPLSRGSENSRSPSAAARASAATRFDGSAGSGPRLASESERSTSRSSSLHPPRRAASAAISATASAAQPASFNTRLISSRGVASACSQLDVEHDGVGASGRRRDAELHHPPAAHVELHPLDQVVAVAKGAGDAWLGGEAVAVLRHA